MKKITHGDELAFEILRETLMTTRTEWLFAGGAVVNPLIVWMASIERRVRDLEEQAKCAALSPATAKKKVKR